MDELNQPKHLSQSSSVYLPLESEFSFHHRPSLPPTSEVDEFGIEEVHDDDDDDDDDDDEEEYKMAKSHILINTTGSDSQSSATSSQPKVATTKPFKFTTESGARIGADMSFTSINESLLRNGTDDDRSTSSNKSINHEHYSANDSSTDSNHIDTTSGSEVGDGHRHSNNPYKDEDATPLIRQGNNMDDPIDDQKTPIMGGDNNFNHRNSSSNSSLLLPQQDLSSKFKRLSLTLERQHTSNNSYQFLSSFQQNVELASKHPKQQELYLQSHRKSIYYAKIHDNNSFISPREIHSNNDSNLILELSSISTTSNQSEITRLKLYHNYEVSGHSPRGPIHQNEELLLNIPANTTGISHNTAIVDEEVPYHSNEESELKHNDNEEEYPGDGDDDDLSTLFIRALHSFDSTTLQLESDALICLSFEKDDLAFVHTIDDSGWGEVTLIDTLERGWIPMNYFTIAVLDEDDEEHNAYLQPLFHACGKFLINPLSRKNRHDKYTFSVKVINSIRDGVRLLLQLTDCLSRSNEIVTKKPVVRKHRKSLLADWYKLMVKANEFKGTSNFNKIEILTLMIYQVSRKAFTFLKVWSIESRQILIKVAVNNYPLLSKPPMAKQRITEIHSVLILYLALFIGRLDLIEHNPVGFEYLENLTHQIILLLRELLFISKSGSVLVTNDKPQDLDSSLDNVLALVSNLVSKVKQLVSNKQEGGNELTTKTTDASGTSSSLLNPPAIATTYTFSKEGAEWIDISCRLVKGISITINGIRKLLEVSGDFKLSNERSYPDYSKMKFNPQEFIKKCSLAVTNELSLKVGSETTSTTTTPAMRKETSTANKRISQLKSYNHMRAGRTSLTADGMNFLNDILIDEGSKFSKLDEFKKFTKDDDDDDDDNNVLSTGGSSYFKQDDELLVDSNGNLLGASFKGLVFTLTNENSPPEYFFVSTFFICFRSFAPSIDFLEELISRFDIKFEPREVEQLIKLKNRRRLIVKMFQLWLESYWDEETDRVLLTTLINFFNEGISNHLPLESIKLIEIAAKLASSNQNSAGVGTSSSSKTTQLVCRKISATKLIRKTSSLGGSLSNSNSRFSLVDDYDLSRINTSSSVRSSILPVPFSQTSNALLLTRNQLNSVEKILFGFRQVLGSNWTKSNSLSSTIQNWYLICERSFPLTNSRPNLLDYNGLEVAKQMTIIESAIFCSVGPEELLNENFTARRANLNLAPNVRRLLLFTNCLSSYVLESVLQPQVPTKMRVNIIKTWLKIAISCLYLRNFNSLAAIIASLQSHLVTRLTEVWTQVSEKYKELYDYLSGIIQPDKNYNVYRTKIRNFLLSNDVGLPVVPYFLLFLQDLTFVTDGNPNYRKANTFLKLKLINIDKYLKITRIIADIEMLQIPYVSEGSQNQLTPLMPLQELILLELWKVYQVNKNEEDRTWKLSCLIQPKEQT